LIFAVLKWRLLIHRQTEDSFVFIIRIQLTTAVCRVDTGSSSSRPIMVDDFGQTIDHDNQGAAYYSANT